MAELASTMVVGPLISMVKEKASSYLLDQYKVMEGMDEQREILERKLPAILDVIEDAEKKGAYRPGVNAWLKALKKVSYEAIDVFDEFKYEALRRDAKKKGHYKKLGMDIVSLFPARNPIVFRYWMGKKLSRIVQTVEVLVGEMNAFRFDQRQQASSSNQWRRTDPVMVDTEVDIVSRSRDEERKEIVNRLLQHDNNEDLMVLPIVGMGGLGKTTFVQLIYNDPQVVQHFDLRRWCCVSDDFDAANIASNICKSSEKDREKALQALRNEITGKKYLIVLDDVWNRDADKWGKLMTCLKQGDKGSVVVTTTRDEEVARVMSMGGPGFNLEKLDAKYLKEIIESRAFSLQKPSSNALNDTTNKIVERCAGSPLAAKAFGSMLRTKTSMKEWKDMLEKSICNERTGILPILKLSFDDLPSHMKKCFALCAMFPKDYEIDVEILIRLWIAHDFIAPDVEENNLEIEGEQIFKELTWRSFFQDVNRKFPEKRGQRIQLRYITTCKIHDLMHDVSLSVMGKDCGAIDDFPIDKRLMSHPMRHLLFTDLVGPHEDDFLKKQSRTLQTLFCLYGISFSFPSTYSSLRALHIPHSFNSQLRPYHLKHLRYLNMSGNYSLEELPEEISMLYNLQSLKLSWCKKLRRLPRDMKYMLSLRHLYTNGCTSLKCMPPGFSQLTALQTLTYFVVGGTTSGYSNIGELRNLNLGDELELSCLENVTVEQAKTARLQKKGKLTHLSLEWNREGHEELVQDCHNYEDVLDALKPHSGLEMLRIVSYKGTSFPTWVTNVSAMEHLTELHLAGCTQCTKFPEFCHLRGLQVLRLVKLVKLQTLCTVFMAFENLKELVLQDLESMEKWVPTELEGDIIFPVLEKAVIQNCGNLTSLPEAPKLKDIIIREDKSRITTPLIMSRCMSSLSSLELSVKDREATLPLDLIYEGKSSLSKLIIHDCRFFFTSSPLQPIVKIWEWFGQLHELRMFDCDALTYWPEEEFLCLGSLKKLLIEGCNKLVGRAQVEGVPTRARDQLLPHLKEVQITSCKVLTELFVLSLSVTTVCIIGCPSFEFIWGKVLTESLSIQVEHCNDLAFTSIAELSPSVFYLPCLDTLLVQGSAKLATIPYVPPSIKSLDIYNCPVLRSISGQLDAIERINIKDCNLLETVGSPGDLPALENLYLEGCKRLTSLPGCLGTYSALLHVRVKYCPAINMKPLCERVKHELNSLIYQDLQHAHSSDPYEGPKLRNPKSWKFAIPGCQNWTLRRHHKVW